MQQLTPDQQRQVAIEIRAGRKIQAIKLFREFTNSGLKEAKDAVEAMEAGGLPADLAPGTQGVFPAAEANAAGVDATTRRQLAAMVQAGRKIEAIKIWREKTGDSLADAKTRVEQLAGTAGGDAIQTRLYGRHSDCGGVDGRRDACDLKSLPGVFGEALGA